MNYIHTETVDQFNTDLLIGLKLTQVCFGANEVIIRFNENSSITIFDGKCFMESPKEILVFLDEPICGILIKNDGELVLSFKKGLVNIPNNDEFESFIIDVDNKSFVSRKML